MRKIGEKLNSSIPRTLEAFTAHDEAAVIEMIKRQSECGADFLDINTALTGDKELENMIWVTELALENSECGIMLDTPSPKIAEACLPRLAGRDVMINSISPQGDNESLIAAAAESGADIVCLPLGGGRVPETAGERLESAKKLVSELKAVGIPENKIYMDALVEAVAMSGGVGAVTLETVKLIKAEMPSVNTICGLSNVSFGLPGRARLNAAFLSMMISAGLDAAILDVTSERIKEALAVTGALLGYDEYCMDYIGYFRSLQ